MSKCVVCNFLKAQAEKIATFEGGWMSGYILGVCDALSDNTFRMSNVCEKHVKEASHWVGQYLVSHYDQHTDMPVVHKLTAKLSDAFDVEISAQPLPTDEPS